VRQDDIDAALIRFELPDLYEDGAGNDQQPVERAELQLYVSERSADSDLTLHAYELYADWVASQSTWLQASDSYAWAEPGCNGLDSDRDRVPCGEAICDGVGRWISIDVTRAVQDWQDRPGANAGLILKGSSEGPAVNYMLGAMNHPNPEARPRLLVEYAPVPVYETFDLDLLSGLNMVSLPIEPVEAEINAALAPMGDALVRVWAYDSADISDPWKMYEPGHPGNDLHYLSVEQGYWFEMNTPARWTITGVSRDQTIIPLRTGWNFVGYPRLVSSGVEATLQSVCLQVELVWYYDASDLADPWKRHGRGMPVWSNDLVSFEPGQGYWILADEDCVLQIE